MLSFTGIGKSATSTTLGQFAKPNCACDQGKTVDSKLGVYNTQLPSAQKTSAFANLKFEKFLSVQQQSTCPVHKPQGKS